MQEHNIPDSAHDDSATRSEDHHKTMGRRLQWPSSLLARNTIVYLGFLIAFLLCDGSSVASQKWKGAPPCYLPVGLALALLIAGGLRFAPIVLGSSLIAAFINYHRPVLSWCGVPGSAAIYSGYIAGALFLREKWPIDPRLKSFRDIIRFVFVSFLGASVSAIFGTLTLLGDRLVHSADALSVFVNWWASDEIAVIIVTPFLLVFVAPNVCHWLQSGSEPAVVVSDVKHLHRYEVVEICAQVAAILIAIWMVFGFAPAIPYQPLYLLFLPIVWVAVRRGIPGATLTVVAIGIVMTLAAAITSPHSGSLPRLQLAMFSMGLTGLCLGGVVTEQKRAEAGLRRSEAGLRYAQRVARMGSWSLDIRSNAVTWTDELFAIFGVTTSFPPSFPEQKQLFTPESWVRLRNCVAHTLRTGAPYEIELETRPSGKQGGWILARGEAQHDENGTVTGLSGIAQDITERKRFENELLSKTALLEAQSNSTIDGLLVVNEKAQRVYLNRRLIEMFGIPNQVLADTNDTTMLNFVVGLMKDPESFVDRVRYLYEHDHETSRDEIELRDGRTFDRYSAPVIGNKHCFGRIWIFRDITERKFAEKELLSAKSSAETANRAKSEFLANMSHEIRTPINGILGMAELLLDTELSHAQREDLRILKSSADSLIVVINDILDFSKIEAGKLELDPIEFDLHDAVTDFVRAHSLRAQQKGLEIICHFDANVPVYILGDKGRLRQTIVNLIGNAVKFTERGEVIVSVRVRNSSDTEVELEFSVADTGVGIPREKHSHIFEAFAQADSSTTRNYGGSGLGLAIASRLVGMMGGRIWVESEPSKGSTFFFTSRFGRSSGVSIPVAEAALHAELLHLPVIIVDDNATNRMILTEMTTGWGMDVCSVAGGAAALVAMRDRCVAGGGFRLAIVDGNMPEMNGFELVEKIKQDPRLTDAVIMMLTSGSQKGDAERCRQLGIASYLLKPIRKAELLSAILSAVGSRPSVNSGTLVERAESSKNSPLRILLVEDNPINQTVALRMLAKKKHEVVLAGNGNEALAVFERQRHAFDLVLMDVQMPGMDGITATRQIRALEKERGGHTPIIAMTARAMKGDEEACIQAGMDAYLAKPIESKRLYGLLARYTKKNSVAETSVDCPGVGDDRSHVSGWDVHTALQRVNGDEELLREIAEIFLQQTPKLLADLRKAATLKEFNQIESAAHTLKGEISYFDTALADQAKQIERMGRERRLDTLSADISRFESALAPLMKAIQTSLFGARALPGERMELFSRISSEGSCVPCPSHVPAEER